MSQSPKDRYLEQLLDDEKDGAHCPRCKGWHAPDGMTAEDFCKRELDSD